MIVSNAGGLAEAVNGHGKIFEMGDVDALAALLDQALIETDDEVMPEACQRYLHRQSKANVARKYLQIFAH